MCTLFGSYEDAPWDLARWPNFTAKEFACKCNFYCHGELVYDPEFFDAMQKARDHFGPIHVNSGHRCKQHNRDEGGAENSQHLILAADVRLDYDRHDMEEVFRSLGFTGIGYGSTFIHVDRREVPASWGYGAEADRLWGR